MANTYVLIASSILSSPTSSITFSSIPSTYSDLVIRASVRGDFAGSFDAFRVQYNTDTSTNYSYTRLTGNGSSVSSSAAANGSPLIIGNINSAGSSTNVFASIEMYIPNYSVALNKPILTFSFTENDANPANMEFNASLWRNTAAINQIIITPQLSTNFVSNSSFYLYGIKNT